MKLTLPTYAEGLWAGFCQAAQSFGDMQARRLFLWLPVMLGAGSAIYLSLRFEPNWSFIAGSASVVGVVWWLSSRIKKWKYISDIAILLLVLIAGVALCKLRAERVRAPVFLSATEAHIVDAIVLDVISTTRDSPRVLIAPMRISGVSSAQTPIRIKLSLRPDALDDRALRPGSGIHALMILHAPSGPAYPGGYDLARQAYFEGVGAQGFAPGRLRTYDVKPQDMRLALIVALNGLRWRLTQSLTEQIGGDSGGLKGEGEEIGGFAAALVSGHQAYVSKRLLQSMRDSGLAHILSISGLHMAMVGGFSFFFLRWLMAMCPPLALRFSIKKIAAGGAMAFVGIYLMISGAPAPAIRAAVVAWIAFGAILVDRQALTLRSLAIAALIVIILTPEAVLQPGFQMSFAATAALLALAEGHRARVKEIDVPWWVRMWQTFLKGVGLSLLASLVAGAATTPFTLAFFNRLTPYGLISNLFEAPVTGLVVMPCLFLGTVLSGTLVGTWLLKLAGLGLLGVCYISDYVAVLPGSVITMPSAPAYVAVIAMAGVLIICLVRGPFRWVGLIIALSIVVWPRLKPPDVWIDAEGGNAAIRTGNTAYALRPKVRLYGYNQWLGHYGLKSLDVQAVDSDESGPEAGTPAYAMASDYECKSYVCTPRPGARYKIGFAFGRKMLKTEVLQRLCEASDLVVLRSDVIEWPTACQGVNHLTRADFARLGSIELTRQSYGPKGGQWLIKAAMPQRGFRPWVVRSSDSGA